MKVWNSFWPNNHKVRITWGKLIQVAQVPLIWIYCRKVLKFMNLTLTLLTCFKYFQPIYVLGNKARIPRSAYFILTNKCFHTHEKGSSQLVEIVLKGYALWNLSLHLDTHSLGLCILWWDIGNNPLLFILQREKVMPIAGIQKHQVVRLSLVVPLTRGWSTEFSFCLVYNCVL